MKVFELINELMKLPAGQDIVISATEPHEEVGVDLVEFLAHSDPDLLSTIVARLQARR